MKCKIEYLTGLVKYGVAWLPIHPIPVEYTTSNQRFYLMNKYQNVALIATYAVAVVVLILDLFYWAA